MEAYRMLRLSPLILKILGWVSLALGVVSAVMIIVGGGTPDVPRVMSALSLVVGVLYWFFLFVGAQLISAILEIRDSIKKTA